LGRWGRGGVTRPFLGLPTAALVAAVLVGCGEGSGVGEGATVNVYAGAAVCAGAKDELARAGEEAGSVGVRVVCTEPVEAKGRLDLAATGADARRAVEDSSSVAYLAAPGPAIAFTRPILDEADLRLIATSSGTDGMATVLRLLDSRGGGESPREAVWNG
jgi:hypothetical protein